MGSVESEAPFIEREGTILLRLHKHHHRHRRWSSEIEDLYIKQVTNSLISIQVETIVHACRERTRHNSSDQATFSHCSMARFSCSCAQCWRIQQQTGLLGSLSGAQLHKQQLQCTVTPSSQKWP